MPPHQNAAFVCAMEDVLEVYSRPRDPKRPLVCLDELCKQLIAEVRDPQPALPGMAARVDYEYERRGTSSAFMVYAPLEQWRGVRVTGQRTAMHWAQTIQWLCRACPIGDQKSQFWFSRFGGSSAGRGFALI